VESEIRQRIDFLGDTSSSFESDDISSVFERSDQIQGRAFVVCVLQSGALAWNFWTELLPGMPGVVAETILGKATFAVAG